MVVITGGITGIGFAAAKLFVEEGAYVFITPAARRSLTRR
jgi:NAD(P)-dependent dehydrogenase (short-subunit alcohol dehydrogenase family)